MFDKAAQLLRRIHRLAVERDDHIARLKEAGISSIALSLDGSTPALHDAFRGVDGSFAWTRAGAEAIVAHGIPLQVNTLVSAQTLDDIPQIYAEVRTWGITRWALFFLIATGRGEKLAEVTPAQSEQLLNWVGEIARDPATPFVIKTTEAHHYRRIMVQKMRRRLTEEMILATINLKQQARFEAIFDYRRWRRGRLASASRLVADEFAALAEAATGEPGR